MNKPVATKIQSLLPLFLLTTVFLLAIPSWAQAKTNHVLVVGDSLAVGIAQPLRQQLAWNIKIDARVGRPLSEGIKRFQATKKFADIVAFSLFTNDDPRQVGRLSRAVSASLAAKPKGCIIWATIVRPAVGGTSYGKANAMLRKRDRSNKQLVLVDWSREIYRHPNLIGPDHVHPTAKGYQRRAQMYAKAIRHCQSIIEQKAQQ